MTLHYIEDLYILFQKIHNGLKPGGQFLFSMEHPVCTTTLQPWKELDGKKYWLVNRCAEENLRKQNWFVNDVEKYNCQCLTESRIYIKEYGRTKSGQSAVTASSRF